MAWQIKDQRFLKKVRKLDNGCWIWTGTWDRTKGYGLVRRNGALILAHRYAFRLAFGEIPQGSLICHHCDIRLCVNPEHLFAGSYADNSADMKAKGRSAKRENHSQATLTEYDVAQIRKLAVKLTQTEIAYRFGIDQSAVSRLINHESWAW